jgi:type IV pilus assembly protein PilC
MSTFKYTATNPNGTIISGEFEAADRDQVAKMIIDQGLSPLKITGKTSVKFGNLNNINIGRVPMKDRVIFLRQLAVLISAGIPIVEAISISQAQVSNQGLKNVLGQVGAAIESGKNLADSFAENSTLFDDMQIQLLKTAEASGSLDFILERIATETESKSALMSKFRGAMIYPILVICAAIVVVALVLTEMIPPMKHLYQSFNATLPWPTLFLINLSSFVTTYYLFIIIAVVIIVLGFILYRRSKQGRRVTDALTLKIPLFGGLIQKIEIINFGKTFLLLTKAGVPVVTGLNMIADSMPNVIFRTSIKEIADEVEKGKSMALVMSKYPVFPSLLWRMIAIGEETGKMEEVVSKVIQYYETETEDMIENLSKLIEPIITIILGVVVGFIGVAVYLPIYTLGNVIK